MHNQQYALPNYVHKGSCRASVQQILATLFSTVCWVPGFLAPQELSDSEYSLAPSCVHPFENDVASSSSLLKKHAAPCCKACNVRTLLRTYRASTMQLIRLGSISLPHNASYSELFRRNFSQIFLWITWFTIYLTRKGHKANLWAKCWQARRQGEFERTPFFTSKRLL